MTALVPCPLCGSRDGYALSRPTVIGWWLLTCKFCGERVTESRTPARMFALGNDPDSHPWADEQWNAAGAYANGLRVENARLKAEIEDAARAIRDEYNAKWLAANAERALACTKAARLTCTVKRLNALLRNLSEARQRAGCIDVDGNRPLPAYWNALNAVDAYVKTDTEESG